MSENRFPFYLSFNVSTLIGVISELRGGPLEAMYVLEQFHCHWGATEDEGSEHTVDGRRYAGEVVHFTFPYNIFILFYYASLLFL